MLALLTGWSTSNKDRNLFWVYTSQGDQALWLSEQKNIAKKQLHDQHMAWLAPGLGREGPDPVTFRIAWELSSERGGYEQHMPSSGLGTSHWTHCSAAAGLLTSTGQGELGKGSFSLTLLPLTLLMPHRLWSGPKYTLRFLSLCPAFHVRDLPSPFLLFSIPVNLGIRITSSKVIFSTLVSLLTKFFSRNLRVGLLGTLLLSLHIFPLLVPWLVGKCKGLWVPCTLKRQVLRSVEYNQGLGFLLTLGVPSHSGLPIF